MLRRYVHFFSLGVYSLFKNDTRNSLKTISHKKVEKIKNNGFNIENLGTFVLQGICQIDGDIFITAYDNNKICNSKIMIFKDYKLIHETDLNTKSHVGGIAFDNIHNIIWITDSSGTISGYEYQDIISLKKALPKFKKIKVIKDHINIYGNHATAFITYFKKKIYVGNFNKGKESAIIAYDVLKDGNIKENTSKVIKGLDFTQGITFFTQNNNTYLLTSSSFILKKSLIRVFKFSQDITDLKEEKALFTYKLKPMLEQIAMDEKGNLYALFESNALKFRKYHVKNQDVEIYENILKEDERK